MVIVSWNDVTAFCQWLSEKEGEKSHLPTEAQWEYACRAGTATAWYSGDDEGALKDHAWSRTNAGFRTRPVAQKSPNAWGLYDMHGNIFEWCQDWFGSRYYASSPMDDPTGPPESSVRVLRGGSWLTFAFVCRASYRYSIVPTFRAEDIGFRVARSIRSAESAPASPAKSGEGTVRVRRNPKPSRPRGPDTPRPAAIPRLAHGKPTGPAPPLAVAPFDANKAKELQTAWAEYLKIPVVLTNSIGMKLVLIPPGEFEMIAASDQKGARVRITKPFYLGQCEVTQEQYQLVAGSNPS